MMAIAASLSFVLGFLIIGCLTKPQHTLPFILTCALSLSFGLGTSGLITFYTFIIFNGYNPLTLIALNGIAIVLTGIFYIRLHRHQTHAKVFFKQLRQSLTIINGLIIGLWALSAAVITFLASRHPFGEWDAWALYNMKTKFLILSGTSWHDLFDKLHWHTQPDYPLLLPFINVWLSAPQGGYTPQLSMTTAIMFTIMSGLILYGGLRVFIHKGLAFLGSMIILVNPYFIHFATAQYADIVLAFYLLTAFLLLMISLRRQDKGYALMAGLSLGLMTFAKNEGIVMSALLCAITFAYACLQNKTDRPTALRLWGTILCGLGITAVATVSMKIFLAPPNRDISLNLTQQGLNYFNWHGLKLVFNAAGEELVDKRWCFLGLFTAFAGITGIPKAFKKENLIGTLFFISYSAVIIWVYLTTNNFRLEWRLDWTMRRIIFYTLPTILFWLFYIHGQPRRNQKTLNAIDKDPSEPC